MPVQVWEKYLSFRDNKDEALRFQALTHFYSPRLAGIKQGSFEVHWQDYDSILRGFRVISRATTKEAMKMCEYYITHPNQHQITLLNHYHVVCPKPVSEALIARCYEVYNPIIKMLEAEDDDDEWLLAVQELNDPDQIIQHIEYRFGSGSWLNQEIWKFYIDYLKSKTDYEALLNAYLRFNRIFINRAEVLEEEYRDQIERAHAMGLDVRKWWIDTIQYEIHFGTPYSAYKVLERALGVLLKTSFKVISTTHDVTNFKDLLKRYKTSLQKLPQKHQYSGITDETEPEETPLEFRADFDTHVTQNFCFKDPLIRYILRKAPGPSLHKLFQTCKVFFYLQPTPVCHNLIINDYGKHSHYLEQSLYLRADDLYFFDYCYNDMIISNYISFPHPDDKSSLIQKYFRSYTDAKQNI